MNPQRAHERYLLAGDACRLAGRYDAAIDFYQRVLDSDQARNENRLMSGSSIHLREQESRQREKRRRERRGGGEFHVPDIAPPPPQAPPGDKSVGDP